METAACCREDNADREELNLLREVLGIAGRIEALAEGDGAPRAIVIAAGALRELRAPLEALEHGIGALTAARRDGYRRGWEDGAAELAVRLVEHDAREGASLRLVHAAG